MTESQKPIQVNPKSDSEFFKSALELVSQKREPVLGIKTRGKKELMHIE
jgi:hypothetical protein